ncbi:hypothetical protein HAX54_039605 [Datura stramonium]|uniref:non-specific serine/threonine protein kinase n=1 Tax=Datura stramonium TaxID=4076 RepID=A0ABS8VNW8_DATST|nr:hypothetical protein [Datura stramonium]
MGPISAAFGENGFFCAIDASGKQDVICWGNKTNSSPALPNSPSYPTDVPPMAASICGDGGLGVSGLSENVHALTAGIDSVCGVCMSLVRSNVGGLMPRLVSLRGGVPFVSLAAGVQHFCGIRQDNHGIMCWGNYNSSLIPKGSGFLAIASSDFITCTGRFGS